MALNPYGLHWRYFYLKEWKLPISCMHPIPIHKYTHSCSHSLNMYNKPHASVQHGIDIKCTHA